ncbi:MAG: hypothetical protein IKH06_02980 [Clostridiales bacterium]|nr:hypothetical protein [Clostridiales bacterium]MBR5182470.1 hypothetical protein [Clostridiales bacterium]
MNNNERITNNKSIKVKDQWSGLADFLARMIEKYGDNLGLDDLPTPEFVYYFFKKAEVYKKYVELMTSKKTDD